MAFSAGMWEMAIWIYKQRGVTPKEMGPHPTQGKSWGSSSLKLATAHPWIKKWIFPSRGHFSIPIITTQTLPMPPLRMGNFKSILKASEGMFKTREAQTLTCEQSYFQREINSLGKDTAIL